MIDTEYYKKRYRSRYRQFFVNSVRSYVRTLSALGYVITPPEADALDANIDAYLVTRPRRERGSDQNGGDPS